MVQALKRIHIKSIVHMKQRCPSSTEDPYTVDGPNTVTISPASAGTDDTLPSLSKSYTSTEYTPVLRGPLEEGHKDMLSGVSNDLQTTLQYVTPVSVSVRYTKHPLTSEPVLKRHTSPMGDEVLTETPITSNVPIRKGCLYMIKYAYATMSSLE